MKSSTSWILSSELIHVMCAWIDWDTSRFTQLFNRMLEKIDFKVEDNK